MTTETIIERDTIEPDELLATGELLPAVLQHLEDHHERSQQQYPGHSSIGRCRRQAGYGYVGAEPDEQWKLDPPTPSIAAWVGTAVHSAFLPVLRTLLHPARIELATGWQPVLTYADAEQAIPVDVLPTIVGHVDLYRRRSQLALDVKTVSRHQLDYVRREGARRKDLLQLHANAASLTAEGKPCTSVAVLYICTETSMDRSDTQGLLYVQAVDPALTAEAVDWWAEVALADDVEQLPRDERGPGLSWACDDCPFIRRCWGPDAVPGQVGAQATLAIEDDAVASALAMLADAQTRYTDAGRLQRAATADKEWAASIIAGQAEGTYSSRSGKLYDLRWKPGQLRLNQQEAKRLLAELNVGAPMQRGSGGPVVTVVE